MGLAGVGPRFPVAASTSASGGPSLRSPPISLRPRDNVLPCRVVGVPERPDVLAWSPSVKGVVEVLHARFTSHVYPMHTHDTWTLLLVDDERSGTTSTDTSTVRSIR